MFENLLEDISASSPTCSDAPSAGHFRVLNRDIETEGTFGYYFYQPNEMLSPAEISSVLEFLAGQPEVSGAQERIVFSGLYYGEKDAEHGFMGVAMDMASFDRNFSDLYYALGQPVRTGEEGACAASWYEYEEGKTLKVGAEYVFLLPNRNGEFVDRFLTVKGGIDFRSMPREALGFGGVYFDLAGFRELVGYEEPLASEVVGFLHDARTSARVLPRLERFLARNHPELKVVSWRDYSPIFAEFVLGFDVLFKTLEAILLAICVLLVVKLTTFSIIERYSEIGTLRAIGFPRADIAFQFALEGFLAIAAGALAGFLLGAAVIGLTHATGIPNSSTFFSYIVGDGFRPGFHPLKIAVVAAIFLAVAVLAPLLPALRGARLSIMKTLEKR